MYLLLLCDVYKTLEGGIKNICANANSFIQKKWECFSRKWIHAFLKFLSNARTYFTYKMICSDKRIIGIISICRNKNKLTSNKFTTLWTIWQLWTISIERLIGTFKVSTVKTKHSCEYYYILAYKMTEAFLRLHLLFTVDTAWNPGKRSSDKMGRWAKHYTIIQLVLHNLK